MKKTLIQLKILQGLGDTLLIVAAFALSYFARVGFLFSSTFPFEQYFVIALITTPITLLFMFFARTYKLSQQIFSLRHVQRLAFVALQNVAVFMVLYYFTFREFFSRLILVYIFCFTLSFLYLWHALFAWILKKSTSREVGVYRVLVVGANRPAQDIVRRLIARRSYLKPVAILDAHGTGQKDIAGIPVVGKLDRLEDSVRDLSIDHIIQADHLEQTVNILSFAMQRGLGYSMPPNLLGVFQGHHKVEEIEGQPFLQITSQRRFWDAIF
ncbi:hypothetical protein FJZ26_05885 [Candidatus Parvarchaeota archaeon]|nr:hypothetical protein [Candidatus Parvarchaeota archaeon]